MVGDLGRDFWIIKSSQYRFSIIMIREVCSGLLEKLKSGLGKVLIHIWWNANSFKCCVVLFQFVQLLQDL